MRASIGVDVGGTFTDLVAVSTDGTILTRKVLSTPEDQSVGVLAALDALPEAVELERLVHGTTVVTNLLLERTGARVVLCATSGAGHLLELRRQERASIYNLAAQHPPTLVAASDVVTASERVGVDGVITVLTDEEAARVAQDVAALQPEAVAVSLLHSYSSPGHERRLGAVLRAKLPGTPVVLGSDVLPEIREYERTATAVAEAYARPRVERYLKALADGVSGRSQSVLSVMTSSGGLLPAEAAAGSAAAMALSGPAGGVVGAAFVARAAGIEDALTIDIGGTSADAGLILGGEPLVEPGGSVAGVPIALPRVLVETVSAGGGSIGWRDEGGVLRVGPRSAGAMPGPAAFGRGGTQATITDAHMVLGHIQPSGISGGVTLNPELSRAAVESLAREMSADPRSVAEAMILVTNAEMARALRRVSVERGLDPAGLTLVAFGGGGPLHACDLAEQLGMTRVLVPPAAGVLSALGLALAAERREAMCSVMCSAPELEAQTLTELLDGLERRTGALDRSESWLRGRYVGQGHEIDVPVTLGQSGAEAAHRFEELHQARYGFRLEHPVEFISARHAAIGKSREARLAVADGAAMVEAAVPGPRTIALEDATLLVRAGWTARPLTIGGCIMERA